MSAIINSTAIHEIPAPPRGAESRRTSPNASTFATPTGARLSYALKSLCLALLWGKQRIAAIRTVSQRCVMDSS